jgi:hypothetical protein
MIAAKSIVTSHEDVMYKEGNAEHFYLRFA